MPRAASAALAAVEVLTGIGRHPLHLGEAALRARYPRPQHSFDHSESVLPP